MKTVSTVLILFLMISFVGRISAQDLGLTQELSNVDSEDEANDIAKYQLSLGVFWRNFLANDLGKWGAGLNYKLNSGTSSNLYTVGAVANVIYNLNQNIGIISGLELAFYSGRASGNFELGYPTSDAMGDAMTFTYKLRNYKEQQQLTLLSLPLMLRLSTNPFPDISTKCFAALGFKVGIPITGRTIIEPGILTTTALFHEENIVYSDVPEQGLVTEYQAPYTRKKVEFNTEFALAFETGVIFMSNENVSAGVSIYCDMGLNNILKPDNSYMVEYQKMTPGQLRFNSIIRTNDASSVEMLSIGLKLFTILNIDKRRK
jgi:hypothetical protein